MFCKLYLSLILRDNYRIYRCSKSVLVFCGKQSNNISWRLTVILNLLFDPYSYTPRYSSFQQVLLHGANIYVLALAFSVYYCFSCVSYTISHIVQQHCKKMDTYYHTTKYITASYQTHSYSIDILSHWIYQLYEKINVVL